MRTREAYNRSSSLSEAREARRPNVFRAAAGCAWLEKGTVEVVRGESGELAVHSAGIY